MAMDGHLSQHLHEKPVIRGIGKLLSPLALKSLNSIEKIQLRMRGSYI